MVLAGGSEQVEDEGKREASSQVKPVLFGPPSHPLPSASTLWLTPLDDRPDGSGINPTKAI